MLRFLFFLLFFWIILLKLRELPDTVRIAFLFFCEICDFFFYFCCFIWKLGICLFFFLFFPLRISKYRYPEQPHTRCDLTVFYTACHAQHKKQPVCRNIRFLFLKKRPVCPVTDRRKKHRQNKKKQKSEKDQKQDPDDL